MFVSLVLCCWIWTCRSKCCNNSLFCYINATFKCNEISPWKVQAHFWRVSFVFFATCTGEKYGNCLQWRNLHSVCSATIHTTSSLIGYRCLKLSLLVLNREGLYAVPPLRSCLCCKSSWEKGVLELEHSHVNIVQVTKTVNNWLFMFNPGHYQFHFVELRIIDES